MFEVVPRDKYIAKPSRKQVLEAAIHRVYEWLVLSPPDAFADQIAARSVLTPAVVRYHFANREALLAEVRRTLLMRFVRRAGAAVAAESTMAGRQRALVQCAIDLTYRVGHEARGLRILAVEARVPGGSRERAMPADITAFKQAIRRRQHEGLLPSYPSDRLAVVLTGLADAARATEVSPAVPAGSDADAVVRVLLGLVPPPPAG